MYVYVLRSLFDRPVICGGLGILKALWFGEYNGVWDVHGWGSDSYDTPPRFKLLPVNNSP